MTGAIQYRKVEKPFSWSYSRVKNFEVCPKKYFEVDVAKNWPEEDNDQLLFGNKLHKAMADRLAKKTPLPADLITYEEDAVRVENMSGKLLVEQKLAITKDFGPCDYFARNAWFRAQGDVLRLGERVAYCGDWKTGKVKEDSVQLALVAACVFAHHPAMQVVMTEFIWLNEGSATPKVFKRSEMPTFWANFLGRVRDLEQAHKTTTFPAKPGGLCKRYCPVRTCPHYGGE